MRPSSLPAKSFDNSHKAPAMTPTIPIICNITRRLPFLPTSLEPTALLNNSIDFPIDNNTKAIAPAAESNVNQSAVCDSSISEPTIINKVLIMAITDLLFILSAYLLANAIDTPNVISNPPIMPIAANRLIIASGSFDK